MAERPDTSRLIDRLAGGALARFIGFTYSSSTPPPLLEDHFALFERLHPFILAMWHGQFMLLPALPRGNIPARVMLALHRDAELMAVALERHGLELIRGAGAGFKGKDRGGANAFRAAARALEAGFTVAMTADVPPGPARRCGHGIVTLARVTGRPILPVALASSRYIALNTWSRLTINLPGSQIGGSFGETITVPPDADEAELERCRLKVEHQLAIATADAYARAGADPRRATPPRALAGEMPLPLSSSLRLYRRMTKLARPVAPMLLARRERRGKEDGKRRDERLGIASAARPEGTLVWFHAASVGETNAALALMDAVRAARPDLTFLLTSGTVTSAEIAAKRLPAGAVHQYVPLDSPGFVGRFLDHWRPDLALFMESEIWPNLVIETANRQIPIAIVNARMSKDSFRRWRQRPGLADPLFSRFTAAFAQNELFALRYGQLGVAKVLNTGNIKYDAVPPPVDPTVRDELGRRFEGRTVWLAASTHETEEGLVALAHKSIRETVANLLTVIVPRHPDRAVSIAAELEGMGLTVARRSRGDHVTAATDIYLADTLGELGIFYATIPVAYIGKSLSPIGGGHNPVEAIQQGAAIISGPHWYNFEDAFSALDHAGALRKVTSAAEIAAAALLLLTDTTARAHQNRLAASTLAKLTGATVRTRDAILALLPDERRAGAVSKIEPIGWAVRKGLIRVST